MSSFSKRLKKTTSGLALLAVVVGTVASSYDVNDTGTMPPAGIKPTHMTLQTLHAAAVRASGNHGKAEVVEHWTLTTFGVSGTVDIFSTGDDFRVDRSLGGIHDAYGSFHHTRWHQGPNGDVIVDSGVHARNEVDARTLQTLTQAAGASLLGEVSDPVNAYVVRVNPPGGRLEYVFYDKTTFLVDRIEEARGGSRYIINYDDFRTMNGITKPWHIHTTIVRTGSESDEHLTSFSYATSSTDTQLAMPSASSAVSVSTFPAALPAKISSDRVIVTVKINGRPVNLQLDSGASTILINSDVIDALHIATIGKHTATMAGTYTVAQAKIPLMTIGDAAMRDVVVRVAPFALRNDDKTVVAGLLGFDFINATVIHIDYAKGTAELLDPKTFTPPASAHAIPIALDDDVPVVAATIGGAVGPHFILDTGADRSALYSAFVAAHPREVMDQGLGTQLRDAWPFETAFQGVGGKVKFRPVQVGPLGFGGEQFPQWLFDATYEAASFEDEDYDGLIGQDVLRYFDVYFDYPKSTIYVVPNERYHDRFG